MAGWAGRGSRALKLRLGHPGWGTGVHRKGIPPGASPVSSLSQASSQALAVAQASSGASGQSLNLSQAGGGSGTSIPGSMGPGGGGQAPGGLGQLSSSGMGGGGSCPRKGTGVVQPLPAAQAVTVSQGSQTEAESAAAKKAEADGTGQQNVEVRREGREPLPDHAGESPLLSRSGG